MTAERAGSHTDPLTTLGQVHCGDVGYGKAMSAWQLCHCSDDRPRPGEPCHVPERGALIPVVFITLDGPGP